jgi:hypothetical protein
MQQDSKPALTRNPRESLHHRLTYAENTRTWFLNALGSTHTIASSRSYYAERIADLDVRISKLSNELSASR